MNSLLPIWCQLQDPVREQLTSVAFAWNPSAALRAMFDDGRLGAENDFQKIIMIRITFRSGFMQHVCFQVPVPYLLPWYTFVKQDCIKDRTQTAKLCEKRFSIYHLLILRYLLVLGQAYWLGLVEWAFTSLLPECYSLAVGRFLIVKLWMGNRLSCSLK